MTTTHTVREWLEQLPEPYRTKALENAKYFCSGWLGAKCEDMADAINSFGSKQLGWESTPEGHGYWSEVWHKYATESFKEPVVDSITILPEDQLKWRPLSDLLDPSEGWTQEGFVWLNTSGDKIKSRAADYEAGISCGEGNKIYIKYFLAPTVLSAMAMVNQYRREQWQ